MTADARFGAPEPPPAPADQADRYGFFAPGTGPVAPSSSPAPFGSPAPVPAEAPRSGLPGWAIAALAGVAGLVALGVVAAVAVPVLLNTRQTSRLAATTVEPPATLIGLPRSNDPAAQAQADRLAAALPRGVRSGRAAAYAGGSSTVVLAAAKPPHLLTIAEQEALTRSFWAGEASSVPADASLGAPAPPADAAVTGGLTCADELTSGGTSTVCFDVQQTALVVYVLSSASGSGSDPSAAAQVPAAVVHVG